MGEVGGWGEEEQPCHLSSSSSFLSPFLHKHISQVSPIHTVSVTFLCSHCSSQNGPQWPRLLNLFIPWLPCFCIDPQTPLPPLPGQGPFQGILLPPCPSSGPFTAPLPALDGASPTFSPAHSSSVLLPAAGLPDLPSLEPLRLRASETQRLTVSHLQGALFLCPALGG